MIQRYGIVHHPLGGFAAVYYEVEADCPPVVPRDAEQFDTIDEALMFADENDLGVPVRIWIPGHPSYVPVEGVASGGKTHLSLVRQPPTESEIEAAIDDLRLACEAINSLPVTPAELARAYNTMNWGIRFALDWLKQFIEATPEGARSDQP